MVCPSHFDLAVIAENYGQMSGVLAGFAFTALVLLMTPTQAAERSAHRADDGGAPLALFSAFVALVLCTLVYSILAGDTSDEARSRAATVELVGGLGFGLAVVSLLQGVWLLMRSAGIDPAAVRITRFIAVVIFPSMSIYFVAQGASDTLALRAAAAGTGCTAPVPLLGTALTVTAAGILTWSLGARLQRAMAPDRAASKVVAPKLVIGASIAAAMASGEISTHSPGFLMSPLWLDLYLLVAAILLTTVGLLFSAAGSPEPAGLGGGPRGLRDGPGTAPPARDAVRSP